MKKIISALSLVLVLSMLACCMSPLKKAPDTSSYIAGSRDEKWTQDINYLEKALPELHKNLYFNSSEKEFIGKLEKLKAKVPKYSDEEINIEMSLIVDSIGDTHTHVNMGFKKAYPMELYWYDEGIYVVNTVDDYKEILNTKLVSINDIPIEDIAKKFKPFFKGANENWFKNMVMYLIIYPDMLKYLNIINDDKIKLKVMQQNGQIKVVDMTPVNSEHSAVSVKDDSETMLYKSNKYKNYWYKYLKDKQTLYININRSVEMPEMPFEIFTQNLFDDMKDKNITKCVIDLRQNQGGDDMIRPLVKKIKKSNLNKRGSLYVIIGRKTYSSGVNAAMLFKKKTNAVFVGEYTGGSPNHYGSTKSFKLPNSQINVSYSTKYIKNSSENKESLSPDINIPVKFKDEVKNEDAALNYIESTNK